MTPVVPWGLHPHRQASCSQTFVRGFKSALKQTNEDNGMHLLRKHSKHLCDPTPTSPPQEEECIFVTFTAAAVYATGRCMAQSLSVRPETDSQGGPRSAWTARMEEPFRCWWGSEAHHSAAGEPGRPRAPSVRWNL